MNLANRLLNAKVLSREQLSPALKRQKNFRGFLADHLVELGILKPDELSTFISPYPEAPETFQDIGLPENLLAQLLLKFAFFQHSFSSSEMAELLKIPMHLVESLINYQQQQKLVDISPRNTLHPRPGHLAAEIRYNLSDSGKRGAEQYLEFNSYVGPVPVTLEDYWDWVELQTILEVDVQESQLRSVFKDFVLSERFFNEIGPAVASCRSIFLFGPSGNGKTVIARSVGDMFTDGVYIPYALFVHGQIIRIFDESIHLPLAIPEGNEGQERDDRWVWCRRPVIIAGGEMTEDALEPKYNPVSKFYEAPHQIQANNGVFIIDDFGRQKISPKELLNRWMFPLETRQEFCNLHTGQQFTVPFDQLIIFCTNLDPGSLADEAFLRRVRHKVFIGYVTRDQFLEIFRQVCTRYQIEFDEKAVHAIIDRYYVQDSRPLRACHPRDLMEKLLDRAKFWKQTPRITYEELDLACQTYFIKGFGPGDYDQMKDEHKPLA